MANPKGGPRQPAAAESSGLIRDVAVWLGAVIVGGGGVFWLLDGLRVRDWWPFRHALAGPDMYDLTRSTVALTGLLGATVAVALAIRRQRSTEQTVRITAEAQLVTAQAYALDVARNSHEQVRDLRDRFTTAAGQLGNDAPAVRLAGIYAMAGLADDWLQREQPEEAQGCIDVLCAYIRTPRRTNSEEDARADLEVRQTIIRTITSRLQAGDRTTRDWRGRDFDFTGATFNGNYVFDRAQFAGGRTIFDGAQFTGGRVTFDGAQFTGGRVSFDGAQFTGSDFCFRATRFKAGVRVSFEDAQFSSGEIVFERADFHGGIVTFNGAKIASAMSFNYAQFAGCAVNFDAARFSPHGIVTFNGAKFIRGTVAFNGTRFDTGTVIFDDVEFAGGTVAFKDAQFARGTMAFNPMNGPWGKRPPAVWPPPARSSRR